MKRPFLILLSTVVLESILVLMISAMQEKKKETKEIQIDELISIQTTKSEAEKKETPVTKDAQDIEEISGLIIEKTMTKIGYEFYEYFFSLWKPPKGIKGYNIHINERASPMWGSLVYVTVNDSLVWNIMLRPRSNDIQEAAANSIQLVRNFLYRQEEIRKQTQEGGDLAGNGIY